MHNRRTTERLPVKAYGADLTENRFEVFESETGSMLGFLEDISQHGFRLVSNGEIAQHRQLSLRIELPEPIKGQNRIEMEAKSLWCSYNEKKGLYRGGFHIMVISDESIGAFEELIAILKKQAMVSVAKSHP